MKNTYAGMDQLKALATKQYSAIRSTSKLTCWATSQMNIKSGGRIRIGCTTAVSVGQDGGIVGEDIEEWQWRESEEAT